MTAKEIMGKLRQLSGAYGVFIPEFTYGDYRIDAAVLNTHTRWIRGFEIKTSKADFKKDNKWLMYSEFCSSLTIVCPNGLISEDEIEKPFGLLWVNEDKYNPFTWKRYPKNFQKRNSLSWIWTYVRVLEKELPRLDGENISIKKTVGQMQEPLKDLGITCINCKNQKYCEKAYDSKNINSNCLYPRYKDLKEK